MSIVNNALSGTLAAQIALNVTSQNIANAATAGYTRQGALLRAVPPAQSGATAPGNGVTVPALIRFSDNYKSQQMWRAGSELGQRNASQPYLTQMEQVIGDDSSNLSNGLDGFFSALNAVSVDPASTPLRQQVLSAADSLAQRFNNLNSVMAGQLTSLHQQRTSAVQQLNATTADIAALNQQISAAQAIHVNASALIDARDQKIDDLSDLVAVQVVNQPDGSISISLQDGPPLVAGTMASTVMVTGNADGSQTLKLSFAKETFTLANASLGGQLGGMNDYEVNTLQPLKQSVIDMADQFSTAVNAQLANGYGTDGSPGGPLFTFNPGAAQMLTVTPGLQPGGLGFSASPTEPGNSANLLALIDLPNQPVTLGYVGTVMLGDANTQLVGKLGTASQQNQAALATAQTVRDQSVETWKSTSGVNSDEEAVNLVTYQQMYQANMKVIAVAGTLFDATLAMMG